MENEDGSRGEHWSLEETTSIANQYGINLKGEKYNKYDWYVALNMIRSDYYRAVVTMTSSDHIKYFVELAKAWLNDKDIEEGKMWYYYCYIMCDKLRKTEGSLVSIATAVSSSQASSNPTSVNTNSGKALLNGSGDQMPTEEISTGNKYLIYYDKRTGVFQTINHIVAPAA